MNRWNTEKNFASRVGPCAYNVATSCRNAIWSWRRFRIGAAHRGIATRW